MKSFLSLTVYSCFLVTVWSFAPAHLPQLSLPIKADKFRVHRSIQYAQPLSTLEVSKANNTTITNALESTESTMHNVETPATPAEETETQKLLRQVKEAGTAGVISYALWELAFWAISLPVVAFGYLSLTGHWPDFTNTEDMAKLGAEAFAFVNFARFAVPLRIGLALSTTPWIKKNIVEKYIEKPKEVNDEQGSPK